MKRLGVALLLAAVLGAGAVVALRWPSSRPALDCEPSQVHLDDAGVARCGPGAELAASQKLTAGAKLDLNRASAEELAVIPGVGPKLAQALVDERKRLGGFTSWEQVDRVTGVGQTRLQTLEAAVEIR
ncbi:MAG: helix-hairpin-helix domain-containing protein [Archangiaceae bacterium]|nr:helix-hairpin-helix domain-containing protein [Archangiaceae bacterium]